MDDEDIDEMDLEQVEKMFDDAMIVTPNFLCWSFKIFRAWMYAIVFCCFCLVKHVKVMLMGGRVNGLQFDLFSALINDPSPSPQVYNRASKSHSIIDKY